MNDMTHRILRLHMYMYDVYVRQNEIIRVSIYLYFIIYTLLVC